MQQRILKFEEWKTSTSILEAKGTTRHSEVKSKNRREFLKKIFKTAEVSALGRLALGKLWDMVFTGYEEEDLQLSDAYLLRLSDNGRDIIEGFYKNSIPNFEDYLKIAEAELLIIFDDWVSKGINCRINQKMYDALVMITLRWGRTNFRQSQFIQDVKQGKFKKALKELQKTDPDLWYLADLEEIKKVELELFNSFEDYDEDDEERHTITAGETGRRTEKPKEKVVEKDLVQLRDTNYSRVKYDLDGTQFDKVNKKLLDDLQLAAEKADVVLTITTAKSGHRIWTALGFESRHMKNIAVDISILNGKGSGKAKNAYNGNSEFRQLGNKLKNELVKLGYTWNTEVGEDKSVFWQTNRGGNHFNHLHISRKYD